MKKILLASVALTAFAGAAAAEVSLTWGGAATVGMAREGGTDAVAATQSASSVAAQAAAIADTNSGGTSTASDIYVDAVDYQASVLIDADALAGTITTAPTAVASATSTTVATDLKDMRTELAAARADAVLALANATSVSAQTTAQTKIDLIDKVSALLNATFGSAVAAVPTGDFDSYSEVNLTATATVTTDYGITVTGAVSVDAGTGYDFADDDGFDAAKTNGVSLDYITIDGGSFGALTFDKNDIEHLVDADDDASADLKYTNTFGVASFALVMDIAKDTDVVAAKAVADTVTYTDGFYTSTGTVVTPGATSVTLGSAAVAADVAWSAKVSAPIADMGTVYAAFDEEGGNAFGGSFLVSGVTIGLDSKLEALEEQIGADRSNTISVAYSVEGLSLGASYNSIKDGNQWAVNAAYAANGMAVAFDTNEAEEWTATASYDLSDAASVDLGVNYTEDAFVGLSLAF